MVYISEDDFEARTAYVYTTGTNPTSTQWAAWLTDASSVINTYLGLTSDTADTATLAIIKPIITRMLRLSHILYRSEMTHDQQTTMDVIASMAAMGIGDPMDLTRREKAMLDDAWVDSTPATGKTNVAVYNTLNGRRVY